MINVLYANDEAGVYPHSYYAATATPLAPFPSLSGEQKCDVCIIGAGYSGMSAALHLRQRGYDVALLDAHRVGWGASGRNGGHVGTGQRVDQDDLIEMVGAEAARKLWIISEDAKALVGQLIDTLKIDCDFRSGGLHANHKKKFTSHSQRYVELLNSEYGYDKVRYVDRNEMRSLLATDAYFDGTFDAGARHLDPLRYAFGLARGCVDAGVTIYECSEVTKINEGETFRVETKDGALNAKFCILAANGYMGALNRDTANRVIPINNYIIATEPLPEETATSLIANNASVSDSKFVVNYYRLSEDRRLLFGGRESYRYKFPSDIKNFVREAMLGIYPQLKDTRIDYGWGGTLAITLNRMPHFKWLSPNMITIGGYSGHGVAMATMGGALAGEAIAGVAEKFDVMQKVPTPIFPGGHAARLPLLALGMAYYSLLDRL